MNTFALATIIASVTIVVLTVVIFWIKSARAKARPYQQDIYAKSAERVVNLEPGFGKTRVVGKAPELGYGYNAKGRRFPKPELAAGLKGHGGVPADTDARPRRRDEDDNLGMGVHLGLLYGLGTNDSPVTKAEDRPAQHHVERGGEIGTRDHDGFRTGGGSD